MHQMAGPSPARFRRSLRLPLTAIVTATAPAISGRRQPETNARLHGILAYVRPEKGRSSYGTARRQPGLRITGACPRNVPELPSAANDRHQQPPANMKLARTSGRRATHGNTLVMRSSAATLPSAGASGMIAA
jgi:hypothetical protein